MLQTAEEESGEGVWSERVGKNDVKILEKWEIQKMWVNKNGYTTSAITKPSLKDWNLITLKELYK